MTTPSAASRIPTARARRSRRSSATASTTPRSKGTAGSRALSHRVRWAINQGYYTQFHAFRAAGMSTKALSRHSYSKTSTLPCAYAGRRGLWPRLLGGQRRGMVMANPLPRRIHRSRAVYSPALEQQRRHQRNRNNRPDRRDEDDLRRKPGVGAVLLREDDGVCSGRHSSHRDHDTVDEGVGKDRGE